MNQRLEKSDYFFSLYEFVEQIKTGEYNKKIQFRRESLSTDDNEWTQTASLEEAINLAEQGWPKGRQIIEQLTEKYNEKFHRLFPQQNFANLVLPIIGEGEEVNMEAILKNSPENMLDYSQDENKIVFLQQGKLQRIIVNGSFHCHTNADTIFNRGAIIASMINCMELAGFQVELYYVQSVVANYDRGSGNYYKCNVRLKTFNESLDLNILSFALCHPSMLRRLVFFREEQCEEAWIINGIVKRSYGYPVNIAAEEIKTYCEAYSQSLPYGNMYFSKLKGNTDFDVLLAEATKIVEEHFTTIDVNKQGDNLVNPNEENSIKE